MSKPSVSPEFPSSLVDEINSLAGGPYIGASYESIMRYNSYEEGSNFKMDESDILLTQVYAGLAVYARDTLDYIKNTKTDETPAMMDLFQLVSMEEKPRFRDAPSLMILLIFLIKTRWLYSLPGSPGKPQGQIIQSKDLTILTSGMNGPLKPENGFSFISCVNSNKR